MKRSFKNLQPFEACLFDGTTSSIHSADQRAANPQERMREEDMSFLHAVEWRRAAAKKKRKKEKREHKERIHGGGRTEGWGGGGREERRERRVERIMMKTMSGEMMRGADERGDDDDADDDETKAAVLGETRGAERGEVYDGSLLKSCSGSPIAVNHVTWLHPVCSQLLTGLKAINRPVPYWKQML